MQCIRFEDGDAYERGMSPWSRLAGETFLEWLAPRAGLRWLDVGCGTGAFAELIAERCAPIEVQGIDPSEGQLAFARMRPGARGATFLRGDAMALPFEPQRFDAAVMALVIFFVPDPAKGAAEMARVVRPGGLVAAYAWDVLGGGFPFDPIWQETRAAGLTPAASSQSMRWRAGGASRLVDGCGTCRRLRRARSLWSARSPRSRNTGRRVRSREACVRRWRRCRSSNATELKARVRARLPTDFHAILRPPGAPAPTR